MLDMNAAMIMQHMLPSSDVIALSGCRRAKMREIYHHRPQLIGFKLSTTFSLTIRRHLIASCFGIA